MRSSPSFLAPTLALAALAGAAGCTIHSDPPPYAASAEVRASPYRGPGPGQPVTEGVPVDGGYAEFDQALSPYGEWLNAPVCGRSFGRVWRPNPGVVGPEFVPYGTHGEWVATDQGWSFVSDWEWGWAAFHYGRWCSDQRFGWVWVPGNQWASAWVDWRYGGDYVGWAPLPPLGVTLSDDYFVYTDRAGFTGRRVTRYGLPRERAVEARRVTRSHRRPVQNNDYSWNAGPPPSEIRGPDGREVRPVHVAPPSSGRVRRVIVRPRH